MQKTHQAVTGKGSPLAKYQDVMVGSRSLAALLYYEWCMMLGPLPGAAGMLLRQIFWPRLFAECGKGCMFAAGITVRHPNRIRLGKSVVIGESCILDGRHGSAVISINIGDNVMLSNNVMLSCKNGTIGISDNCGLNSQTIIQSCNGCPVEIGSDCVIGQQCFIIGGGSYNTNRLDIPMREQGLRTDGGVRLEADIWLGGNVTVLGGVTMGRGSIAGAGSVLTKSVGIYTVSAGVPAKVIKTRQAEPQA
ncbi:MAG: Acetyltransferase (isoleucine patch superfamily) [Candidatus Electronema aureum]|uniref:Acetyltransferase (Isoleucine patch superfamily) n=1 Tax=Candidatus Electronema aureum TaxID=2005002 RepID=A0A521G0S8_9BACT|nr:MAG: Acetyltransferase (isoleucine patch superfamily) [Candidatus Electronema aureum]